MRFRGSIVLLLLGCFPAACAGGGGRAPGPVTPAPEASPAAHATPLPADASATALKEPVMPPPLAFLAGLMPLRSAGVDQFREAHPTYDGRGVLIGILDTGIDPSIPGLIASSTGSPKLIDVRDFSGEGRVALSPVAPAEDGTVAVGGRPLSGAGRIGRLTSATTWYAGEFRELPLGNLPAADVNGNGTNRDVFPVIVAKAMDGWVAFIDSNLDGSFEDEMPLHDYRQGRETIALGTKPLTLAANLGETGGVPTLDLLFDTSGHGTHVAGIAAGHDLFNVAGFDGVAPGAQLLGLKIANSARGGISVHGSMLRAMEYAARFAEQRNLALVLNMSFGVGNEREGHAVIDSVVNAFLTRHPAVVFTISAGNDGPGLSTVGLPGSADLALSVGATLPGPFVPLRELGRVGARDLLEAYSSRGGEVAKPDLVVPGWAFSSVPRWDTGNEVKTGTSFAAPYAAGLAACLLSAFTQEGRQVSAAEVMQALRVSAAPLAGASVLDAGAGMPRLEVAYRWLLAGHQGSEYVVRTAAGGSAAFRRDGLAGPADTVETFLVRHVGGQRAAQFLLRADVPWLTAPAQVTAEARHTEIPVVYRAASLATPGVYVGKVEARNPTDTLAGPLFTLTNTVIVPYDLTVRSVYDERRVVAPAQVQRYFLRVSQPAATLHVSVVLPDSLQQHATVRLFEPNGQPARAAPEDIPVGGNDSGTARLTVRAEDLVPGVYELDVLAPPLSAVTVTARAELGPVALAPTEAGWEASNAGATSFAGHATQSLVGVEQELEVEGRGARAESLTVRLPPPDWAARAVIDVDMPREQWDELTDFGVTVFDSAGAQVSQGPLNYAFGRQSFEVAARLAAQAITIELFPAFALAQAAHPWRATVRVRYLLGEAHPLGGPMDLGIVPGGRVLVPVAEVPALALPDGFWPLVEARVRPATQAPESVRRVVVKPRE